MGAEGRVTVPHYKDAQGSQHYQVGIGQPQREGFMTL